ncbi:hypothetical protein NHX12_029060, partial [Muraenolepis orangiensis]
MMLEVVELEARLFGAYEKEPCYASAAILSPLKRHQTRLMRAWSMEHGNVHCTLHTYLCLAS